MLDMSSPKDVARFGQWYVREGKQLDVLVNNAGCMVNTREVDENGLEKNFATNTLGTHILTCSLVPALLKVRVGNLGQFLLLQCVSPSQIIASDN